MLAEFTDKIRQFMSHKEQDQSDLEKYIVANQPQTTNDIDRLEEEYNQRRFTGMGRHEYFPVTR